MSQLINTNTLEIRKDQWTDTRFSREELEGELGV